MDSAAKRARQLAAIRRGHGILKRKPGDKPFAKQWAEHKHEELALERAEIPALHVGPEAVTAT